MTLCRFLARRLVNLVGFALVLEPGEWIVQAEVVEMGEGYRLV